MDQAKSVPEGTEPDYIICDGWAVMGPSGTQRQHAVTLVLDENGIEWVEFKCGAGNAVKYASKQANGSRRVLRSPKNLRIYNRDGLIEDREICEQHWCQKRHRDFVEHSEEFKARRAEEDARIAAAMPLARERLLNLERRLANL